MPYMYVYINEEYPEASTEKALANSPVAGVAGASSGESGCVDLNISHAFKKDRDTKIRDDVSAC